MGRAELIALWLLAAGLRSLQVAFEPAYLHPDALYQGLEPAFRAVYGHGVVSWEFKEGLRSWTWPGLLAAPFALLRGLGVAGPGQGMASSVALARMIPVALDLLCLHLAMGLARQRAGLIATRLVGWLAACHPAWVIMAAQPLIDVPAATLTLLTLRLALPLLAPPAAAAVEPATLDTTENRADRPNTQPYGRLFSLGAVAAATALVRVQLAPAVAVLATLWLVRRRAVIRQDAARILLTLALGALLIVVAWGLLDWLTWGAPWHTVRAYLTYNLDRGQTAFGVMPADTYWVQLGNAVPWLRWVALPLLLVGARRAPWIAAVLVAIVLPHQWVLYKVWRFLHPALWVWLILLAIGADDVWRRFARWRSSRSSGSSGSEPAQRGETWAQAAAGALLVALVWGAWHDGGVWRTTWLFHQGGEAAVRRSRGLNRAVLAASRLAYVGRVVQAVVPAAAAPGHALLGHDADVLHPLGARVDRSALADRDTWFVVDAPGEVVHPEQRRLFRDWQSGVAVFQIPEIVTKNRSATARSDAEQRSQDQRPAR